MSNPSLMMQQALQAGLLQGVPLNLHLKNVPWNRRCWLPGFFPQPNVRTWPIARHLAWKRSLTLLLACTTQTDLI